VDSIREVGIYICNVTVNSITVFFVQLMNLLSSVKYGSADITRVATLSSFRQFYYLKDKQTSQNVLTLSGIQIL
jgi:hypothetical protein